MNPRPAQPSHALQANPPVANQTNKTGGNNKTQKIPNSPAHASPLSQAPVILSSLYQRQQICERGFTAAPKPNIPGAPESCRKQEKKQLETMTVGPATKIFLDQYPRIQLRHAVAAVPHQPAARPQEGQKPPAAQNSQAAESKEYQTQKKPLKPVHYSPPGGVILATMVGDSKASTARKSSQQQENPCQRSSEQKQEKEEKSNNRPGQGTQTIANIVKKLASEPLAMARVQRPGIIVAPQPALQQETAAINNAGTGARARVAPSSADLSQWRTEILITVSNFRSDGSGSKSEVTSVRHELPRNSAFLTADFFMDQIKQKYFQPLQNTKMPKMLEQTVAKAVATALMTAPIVSPEEPVKAPVKSLSASPLKVSDNQEKAPVQQSEEFNPLQRSSSGASSSSTEVLPDTEAAAAELLKTLESHSNEFQFSPIPEKTRKRTHQDIIDNFHLGKEIYSSPPKRQAVCDYIDLTDE